MLCIPEYLKKAKSKGGITIAEKIAAEKERKAKIEAAKQELAKWQEIAGVAASRKAAPDINDASKTETVATEETKPAESVEAPAVEEVQATNEMQPVEEHPTVTAAEEGRDTVGGSPVALAYLLEGGKGSILNAGYFLHGVAAAFPAITNEIEALRNAMSGEVLGMGPMDFATQRAEEIAAISELIEGTYGEEGLNVFSELLNNADGFYPRGGQEVAARIEALQPIEEQGGEEAMPLVDNQGNPIDTNGKLVIEEVSSIDEITDEDFEAPTRNVQLPAIPENIANAIGTEGRSVIIKKNVFLKNGNTHVELEPADSRAILKSALYNPNLVGSTQPIKRPDYKVAIRTGEKNAVVVLDVFRDKEHVEIVGWRLVNEKGLAKMQRQAEREGGQFLILSPNDGAAAALSALPLGLSSTAKDTPQVSNEQENEQKSGEKVNTGVNEGVPENAETVPTEAENRTEPTKKVEESSKSVLNDGLQLIEAPTEVTEFDTADEFVAGLLGGIKITPESFRKETGLGIDEQRKLVGIIAGEDKGGVSVERASEIIAENYAEELAASGFHGDVQDIRNMLIDILSSGNPRTYVKQSKERRAVEWVEQEIVKADAWAEERFGFASYADMLMYEETALERIEEKYRGFDEQEYFNILAENYNYDTTRESERVGNGSEVLQGERAVPSPRTENIGERNEGAEVRYDVQGSDKTADAQEQEVGAPTLLDVVRVLYSKGKEVASKLFSMKFFDVAKTPKFMQELGLRGDKFTIRYGVISRHFGKDKEHTFSEEIWEQIPKALREPFAITRYYEDENKEKQKGYRLYTTLQLTNGAYVVVSAEVKSSGRNIEVNAINTIFGRNSLSEMHDEVIYISEKITPEQQSLLNGNNPHQYTAERESLSVVPEQSSLLKRPNFAQYPTEQELSEGKDTAISETTNEIEEKNVEWRDMSAQERMDVAAKSPLTVEEINNSSVDAVNKANAVAFVNGTNNFITQLSYLKVYEDVRNRPSNSPSDNGGEDNTQLAETNDRGSADGRAGGENGDDSLQDGAERSGEDRSVADGAESSTREPDSVSGETRNSGVRGEESSMDGVSADSGNSRGGGKSRSNGGDGRRRGTRKQRREFAERERQRMVARVENLAKKLNLDNVEIVTDASTLEGKKRTAKGFYSKSTGKITIVIPNHSSVTDAVKTLLHEAVAHYGLRKLFGEHFDTFLDNVFNNADESIRRNIKNLAENKGWDLRKATEEYIAGLAEDTNFENAKRLGWWGKIKKLFLDMLHKIGFEGFDHVVLTDNELRYILWRSYENLREPGKYRSILGEVTDVAKQYELKVGNYAESITDAANVAEESDAEYDNAVKLSKWFNSRHKGAAPVVVIQSEDSLEEQLVEMDFSQDEIDYIVERYKKDGRAFCDTDRNVVVLLRSNLENKLIKSTLWHEAVHKVIKEMGITDKQLDYFFELQSEEEQASIKEFLRNAGYDESEFAEEYLAYYIQDLYESNKINYTDYDLLSRISENADEKYVKQFEFVQPIINNIVNGTFGFYKAGNETGRGRDGERGNSPRSTNFGGENRAINGILLHNSASGANAEGKTGVDDDDTLFRMDDAQSAIVNYNRRVLQSSYQAKEALQDSMLSLKEAQEAVVNETGKAMRDDEDAYMAENALSSVNTAEAAEYKRSFYQPLVDEVAAVAKKMEQQAHELAAKLNTPVEVRESADGLSGKKSKAKGWYDVKSGKIVVVVSNHSSVADIQATVLHEVVAHKGLRKLFGEHFDTFLDNVYNNVDANIRAEIDALAEKYGNTREATEEYLASLAEDTRFEKVDATLWGRIKQWFLNMLAEAGIKLDFELSDNELRYILWRSYQNLANPGRYNIVKRIEDVAVRARLGIGEYAPASEEIVQVAEENTAEYTSEEQQIIADAKANGSYMKAPNGQPTKLNKKQWAQVRTANFKKWFGDWEKATRIEKLKMSKPVEITGQEIKASEDIKEYKQNALEYGKSLRGEYTNADTGASVQVNAQSIKEVLHHDYKDVEHLQSVAAIPMLIERGVYIDTVANEGNDAKSKVKEYQYYVCGLKIGGVDYTVKLVIAVDNNGNRYYDHKLTEIEKSKLLDELDRITSPSSQEENALSAIKDKRLLSILQTNSSKIVDENGEPMVVYHRTPKEFTSFDKEKIGSSTDWGAFGKGFYLSPADFGSIYGENLMSLFVNVKNPLILDRTNAFEVKEPFYGKDYSWLRKQSEEFTEWVKDSGYDGVWYIEGTGRDEIVAFEPNQMKSASDNTGDFSENENDIRFRERDDVASEEGKETIDDIPTRPMTLMERVKASLLEASAKNKKNLKLRRDALRNLGQDLANVLKLMRAQRKYDKSTVETLMTIAKMYFKDAQLLDKLSAYEVTRIMGVLKRSVGKQDIESEAMKLMDILLDAHNKALTEVLAQTEKVKAKKVNAAGVEVMGRLDKYGQELVETYREITLLFMCLPDDRRSMAFDGEVYGVDLVRPYMYEMGLTQTNMAKILWLVCQGASEYLTGKCGPTLKVTMIISKQLDIDANVVFRA